MGISQLIVYTSVSMIISYFYLKAIKVNDEYRIQYVSMFKSVYYIVLALFMAYKTIFNVATMESSILGVTFNLAIMEGIFGMANYFKAKRELDREYKKNKYKRG